MAPRLQLLWTVQFCSEISSTVVRWHGPWDTAGWLTEDAAQACNASTLGGGGRRTASYSPTWATEKCSKTLS